MTGDTTSQNATIEAVPAQEVVPFLSSQGGQIGNQPANNQYGAIISQDPNQTSISPFSANFPWPSVDEIRIKGAYVTRDHWSADNIQIKFRPQPDTTCVWQCQYCRGTFAEQSALDVHLRQMTASCKNCRRATVYLCRSADSWRVGVCDFNCDYHGICFRTATEMFQHTQGWCHTLRYGPGCLRLS